MGLPAKYHLPKVHEHYLFRPEENCYKNYQKAVTKFIYAYYC